MAIASDSVRRSRPLLGTFVEITVLDARQPNVTDAIEHAFETVARVHRLMSFHDPDSDVSRLNFRVGSEVIGVDPWTYEVLEASADLHRRSAGAFDITVAPALQDIGLLPRHDRELSPRPAARQQVDAIELLPENRVRFRHPSVGIDLGGIAKGYAVDRAIDALKESGIESGVVNAGGDLAAFGPNTHIVDIRDPGRPDRIMSRIAIRDQALASTGGTFDPAQSVDVTGLAVIDPKTQRPACGISGASVFAKSCMTADAMTKIVLIERERSLPILEHFEAGAMFSLRDGTVSVTDNWKDAVCDAG